MTANHIVCIKRPDPGLLTSFEDMYLNERLVDITIFCSDGQVQAHKLVLAASSPYFSNLFEKLTNPFHHPVIVLKDMRVDDLRLILEFMYRGQLTLGQDKLSALMKIAENLQITGLTDPNKQFVEMSDQVANVSSHSSLGQRVKRMKKGPSSHLNVAVVRSYQTKHLTDGNTATHSSSHPERLLHQSMIIDEPINNATPTTTNFNYSTIDPNPARNLNNNSLHTPSPSSLQHLQQLPSLDSNHHHQQQQQQHQQQLSSQLQVLSHSLTANRSSLTAQATTNGTQQASQGGQQSSQTRSRSHSCHICWKSFREKANLKRHLQIHNSERIIYECEVCNKSFSWKDNFIRHTKTSHHMNNVRTRK